MVSGEDIPNSSADITLAHELIHALRGEDGIKSINTIGGINEDEEAHTIELENNIREELGYEVRKDGDISDGGDGSYGKYSDSSEEDWYNKIDEMQGSETLSGNAYSNYLWAAAPGSNFSPAHPDSPHRIIYEDGDDLRDALAHEIGDDDCDCDCDCQWGSSYDDSIWDKGGSVSVVNNVVSGVSSWGSFSVPKRNWGTFFKSNSDTEKTSSGITTAVSNYVDVWKKTTSSKNKTIISTNNIANCNNQETKDLLKKLYPEYFRTHTISSFGSTIKSFYTEDGDLINMPMETTNSAAVTYTYDGDVKHDIYQVGLGAACANGLTRGECSVALVWDADANDFDVAITTGIGEGSPSGGATLFVGKISASNIKDVYGSGINAGASKVLGGDYSISSTSEGYTLSIGLGSTDAIPETHATVTETYDGEQILELAEKRSENNIDEFMRQGNAWYDELIKKGLQH